MAKEPFVITSNDILLFEPSDRSMVIDYPELAQYEEFSSITPRDLKFVWYVSNRTSPLIREPRLKRIKKACELAYDKKALKNNKRINDIYEKSLMPEDIVAAISVMSKFNPDFRMRAKMLNEYNFDQLQSLVYLDSDVKKAFDIEDRKKYAELLIKTSDALQKMVTNMESSYGVKIKREKQREFEILASVEDIIERVEEVKQ